MKLDEIKKYYNLEFVKETVIKFKNIDFKKEKSNPKSININNLEKENSDYKFITFDDYKIKGMNLNILVSENYDKYVISIPIINDCYVVNIKVPTEQDVIDYLNEELNNKEEMCFEISGDRYLELHRCDDGWDYTIYDKDLNGIDGGIILNKEFNLTRVLEVFKEDSTIPKEYKLDNLKPIDYLEGI